MRLSTTLPFLKCFLFEISRTLGEACLISLIETIMISSLPLWGLSYGLLTVASGTAWVHSKNKSLSSSCSQKQVGLCVCFDLKNQWVFLYDLGLVVSKRIFHLFCSQKLEGFYVSFIVQNYMDFLNVLGFMGRKLEQNI